MKIRPVTLEDLDAISSIYNDEILHGVATFDVQPMTKDARLSWFQAHQAPSRPALVAEIDNRVAGYATLSTFNPKEAYRSTAELSVYVDKDFQGQGVGSALMDAVINLARKDSETHCVMSLVTSENLASRKLHAKFGFTYCGTLPEVGRKFGRLLSVDCWALIVD
ncbi:MAG TPA: GNAT family N-acetyltransferase [Sutterella sp.]|nr:GNAT family N-acetyltransferase [Sutterella sp.]